MQVALTNHGPALYETGYKKGLRRLLAAAALFFAATLLPQNSARAQVNGVGAKPYLGWSTYSQQTIANNVMNDQNILAQSDSIPSTPLQPHAFQHTNTDTR